MPGPARAYPDCIDENAIAAYAERRGDERARAAVEEHLADCSDCRTVLTRAAGFARQVERARPPEDERVDAAEPPGGTPVDRYVIERCIGRGAMGVVYAAYDPDLDRMVAVKILRPDVFGDARRTDGHASQRLLREAKAMARLSHPYVITVHDVGVFRNQLFVAMEYIDGETLRHWRSARHRSAREILAVYERAGSGLAAAHDAGLVHRDFKPDNVLVARDGRVRVTDFGLARAIDGRPRTRPAAPPGDLGARVELATVTRTGALLGTPAYMAPEQLRGETADARSDVFAFCVSLYEALYGERPFPGRSVDDLGAAIEAGRVRAPPITSGVPRWMRAPILRGLRAPPEERFASMRELLGALRAAHARSVRRRRGIIGAAAGLAVMTAAAGLYARRMPESRSEATPGAPSPLPSAEQATRSPGLPPLSPAIEGPAGGSARAPEPLAVTAIAAPPSRPSRPAPAPVPVVRAPAQPLAPERPAAVASTSTPAPAVGHNGALILE